MIGLAPGNRALAIGVFLVPLIFVKGTAIMMTEPRGASGSTGRAVQPPALPDLAAFSPECTEEQFAVLRRVEQLREMAFGPSPLLHGVEESEQAVVDGGKPKSAAPPVVSVQAILRSSSGNLARIRHKLFREGDELGNTGWFVDTIDAESRSVKIVHRATESEAMLNVPLPQ